MRADLFRGGDAEISACGRYRYSLKRRWDAERGVALWVMLNPSTADACVDDPTIRRCVSFSKAWGFGEIQVVNLFAFRSTDPKRLRREADPVGPENDAAIARAALEAGLIVAAWGGHDTRGRADHVLSILRDWNVVRCLGTTKGGHPRHPLYVPAKTPLTDYRPKELPVTRGDRDALRRLLAAAASAPWEIHRYDDEPGDINWQIQQRAGADGPESSAAVISNVTEDQLGRKTKPTADLIVAAINALPALLDALEAAEQVVKAAQGVIEPNRLLSAHEAGERAAALVDALAAYDDATRNR